MSTPTPQELALQLRITFDQLIANLSLLEPEEMERARLAGGWTPKALVAHVAFWDRVQTKRMQDAMSGGSAETGFVRPDRSNDERASEDDSRPLDTVVDEAENARRAMIVFAEQLQPAALERVYPEGERQLSLVSLLEHMVRHTRSHSQELAEYCGSMHRWQRAALREFLVRQHCNLMDSIAGLDETTLVATNVSGFWSIRDVLTHLLSWNEYGFLVLKGWPKADLDTLAPWLGDRDDDEINAGLMATRAELDMIAIADGLATYHRRMLRLFDQASDEQLASAGDFGWGEHGEMARFLYSLALHDAEHAEDIWRIRVSR